MLCINSKYIVLALTMLAACGPPTKGVDSNLVTFSYSLARQYTGKVENSVTIIVDGESDDRFVYEVASDSASVDKPTGSLKSETVTLTYSAEGLYKADFKIDRVTGSPFIYEVLSWEYSTEKPDAPIISFADSATKSLTNFLQVSDSRSSNTTGIWLKGDIVIPSGSTEEDGGYWQDITSSQLKVPLTLTTGDGLKTVHAKFQNIYGNASAEAEPAEIILKQNAATECKVSLLNPTIANNKVSLKLFATDPYQMYYSVTGDVKAVVDSRAFTDRDIVYVYVEPTPGEKTIYVTLQDIAGNICEETTVNVTLDPNTPSERIEVENSKYWTDSTDVVLDVYFEYFAEQEPLEVKITGDVTGPNVRVWLTSLADIAVSLTPTTSGERRIYAQYRDSYGDTSYLLAKQIFLQPGISITDIGGGQRTVTVSLIPGTKHMTITGCSETYNQVDLTASYTCTPNAGTISVTWTFNDDSTLNKTGAP